MRYTVLLLRLFLVSQLICAQAYHEHIDAIISVVRKYERPLTLLEIGKSSSVYLAHMPFERGIIGELIVIGGDAQVLLNNLQPECFSSISLMVPPQLTVDMLSRLSRCEHFDIVLVHDISSSLAADYAHLVSVLTSLGDHVFMAVESEKYDEHLKRREISCVVSGLPEKPSLYLSHLPKKGLDLARYTQNKARSLKPRYTVHSTYQHKQFFKEGLSGPVPWVHGINLVTFCMFHGVYPHDQVLRNELALLRQQSEDHNDAVIGNFILQGSRLLQIDSKDPRRNADPYNLLNAALDAFKRGNARLTDPQGWINGYYLRIKS